MKCDNCLASWEQGGMTSCGYECDAYGCIIHGLYYGGEGESCYLTEKQVERRLKEYKDYTAGKIERPKWIAEKFMRELDDKMTTAQCGLPGYPPKWMRDGYHKSIYGTADLHYERVDAYQAGYKDAKAGKPMRDDYYAKHKGEWVWNEDYCNWLNEKEEATV